MTTSIDLDAALNDVLEHEYDQPDGTTAVAEQEPYVTALPLEVLFADHTYQRELDEKRVLKMAKAFRLALVGIVEVSDRGADVDGPRYAILDGQHRWATVRDRSFSQVAPHLPCRVHTGLTVDQEAKLYHELNTTRKQLTGWDRWLARRGAGDPIVRDIEALLDRHGLVVSLRGGGNVFRATRTAEKIVELNGLPLLEEVIGMTRAAWPDDQNGMDGHILHGLAHVLNVYTRDELDTERLITELAGILPRQLAARAAAVRELHKGTVDRLVGHVIVERYNASKGPKLEAFFSRVKPVSKAKTTKAKYEEEYRAAAKAWASETRYNGSTYHARAGKDLVAAFVAAGQPGAPAKPEASGEHVEPGPASGGGSRVTATETKAELDPVVVQRVVAGDADVARTASPAERRAVVAEWTAAGRSQKALEDFTGWKVDRYLPMTT